MILKIFTFFTLFFVVSQGETLTDFQKYIKTMSSKYGMKVISSREKEDSLTYTRDYKEKTKEESYLSEEEVTSSPETFFLDIRGGVIYNNYKENKEKKIIKRMPFPDIEYRNINTSGENSIMGRIYLENSDGEMFLAKESRIFLNPKTTYSNQWFSEVVINKNILEKADKKIYSYLRFSTSDSSGEYSMGRISRGDYYLSFAAWCYKRCGNTSPKRYFGTVEISFDDNRSKRVSPILTLSPQRQATLGR